MSDRLTEITFAGELPFAFQLRAQSAQFGEAKVVNVWMDAASLYGQRGRVANNLEPMANYFWMRSCLEQRHTERAQQEIYLLANLSPYVRSNAAQRVLADAWWDRKGRRAAFDPKNVEALEGLLSSAPDARRGESTHVTMMEFYEQSRALLMREYTPSEREAYSELGGKLFDDDVCRLLMENSGRGIEAARARWDTLNEQFGRRSGHPERRVALDVLSYEAKAAVRRCYSCVWNDLVPRLVKRPDVMKKHDPAEPTARFLRLMHTEVFADAGGAQPISVFHGHVFSLQPAMAMLLQTATGKRVIGEYLIAGGPELSTDAFERLLRLGLLSLYRYQELREINTRRKQP